MLRSHDRTLTDILSSSDESDWELYVKYLESLEELMSTEPKKSPFGITLQCASILHTCGLIMGKCNKALPDGRTVNDLDDAIFLLLQKDMYILATGEPVKRKVISVGLQITAYLWVVIKCSSLFLLAETIITLKKAVECWSATPRRRYQLSFKHNNGGQWY